jgi:asparagine synthase (glutamine-hydrolysing)
MLRAVRLREAFAQAHRLASNARGSAWKTLWKYGITPLLPRTVRNWSHASSSVPAWIEPRFAMQYGVRSESQVRFRLADPTGAGSWRQRFFNWTPLPTSSNCPSRPKHGEKVSILHRPLVEFSLSLPRDMTFRDGTTKWILREAGRGLVPDEVRMRKSKGWIDGRTCWALSHRYQLLSKLLKDPLVVQAGWVQLEPLRARI